AFLDRPVAAARSRRANPRLPIDLPRLWISRIVRIVEYRDVRGRCRGLGWKSDVDPHRALACRPIIALPGSVDDVDCPTVAPGESQEHASVVSRARSGRCGGPDRDVRAG